MVNRQKRDQVEITQISTAFDPPMFLKSYLSLFLCLHCTYILASGKTFHPYCLLSSYIKERKGTITVGRSQFIFISKSFFSK